MCVLVPSLEIWWQLSTSEHYTPCSLTGRSSNGKVLFQTLSKLSQTACLRECRTHARLHIMGFGTALHSGLPLLFGRPAARYVSLAKSIYTSPTYGEISTSRTPRSQGVCVTTKMQLSLVHSASYVSRKSSEQRPFCCVQIINTATHR